MILNIETGRNNPILRKKSKIVKKINKKTLKLIKDMEETMIKNNGIGLAAPQVGIHQQIILVTLDNKKIFPMINPKILEFSEKSAVDEEGCLSLPGEWGKVRRPKNIIVRFLNIKSQEQILKFTDFHAREIQHEIDHLNGILFTDYLEQNDIVLGQLNSKEEVEKI